MKQAKALVLKKIETKEMISFATLFSVIFFAPLLGNQLVTGPLVNASLFLGVFLLGLPGAILLGVLPSIIALGVGLLPALMTPMIPFIMASNILLVTVFYFLKKHFFGGVVVASFLKFSFLYLSGTLVLSFLGGESAPLISSMMGYLQLLTALMGGLIAFLFLKVLPGKIF